MPGLRNKATDAEKLLWAFLRSRRLCGAKFRRQHPVGRYVLDFYCHEASLGIELDGGHHNEPGKIATDEERSRAIAAEGIRILRFWNHDVLQRTEAVLTAILAELPHPNPPPEGEGGSSPLPPGDGKGEGVDR